MSSTDLIAVDAHASAPANTASDAAVEDRRVAMLHALALLDTDPEREFDSLVALAAEMLDCPTALMTLVDRDRLWIKAANSGEQQEFRREDGFCNYTIRGTDPLVIGDLSLDPRFETNALVAAPDGARFYAGAPIHATDDGGNRYAIGALCVLDTNPRSLTDAGRRALQHLAVLAETTIAARTSAQKALAIAVTAERQSATLTRQDQIFRQAERMAAIGSWRAVWPDGPVDWSDGVFRIHDLPIGATPRPEEALAFYPPHARGQVAEAMTSLFETGSPFDFEVDFLTAAGEPRRVRILGEREASGESAYDDQVALIGIFQDVTDRHALEVSLRRSADTDALTGIANRAAFDRALQAAMARARCDQTPLMLALVDLDGFKAINDTLGHNAGDDVLREVGDVLRAPWLCGSFAARLGGDEFAVILEDPALVSAPDDVTLRLQDALRFPVVQDGLAMVSAGTVGLAALQPDTHSIRDFVHRADTHLYKAKRERIGERRRGNQQRAA